MAAKSKKRLSKTENNLLKLENLELKDVLCSICQSILVQPVTLPCLHGFCQSCFNGSVENNALCCPLCRMRIGSWLRTATKQKCLVNENLWNFIQTKFSHEIKIKLRGEDVNLPEEKPFLLLSAPGEIRQEYEAELNRLRKERLQLEEKHVEETELLIKKIQQEEEEAYKKYLEALKKDEMLAQQLQNDLVNNCTPAAPSRRFSLKHSKHRLKNTKIDGYLSTCKPPILSLPPTTVENSGIITADNTRTDRSTPKAAPDDLSVNGLSPEMVPTFGQIIRSRIDKKKPVSDLWNKENGERQKEKKEDSKMSSIQHVDTEDKSKVKHKMSLPSLVVSLPLPCSGIVHQKHNTTEVRAGADSVDSMRQELCYFKPIEEAPSSSGSKGLPLRVPGARPRPAGAPPSPVYAPPPTRAQYLQGLCNLRHLSLINNLPSAFIIALELLRLRSKKGTRTRETRLNSAVKNRPSISPGGVPPTPTPTPTPVRRNTHRYKQMLVTETISEVCNLRRTRSMGSISKDENEITPKKAKTYQTKQRKSASDKKPYLRSESKKCTKKEVASVVVYAESLNNNKISLDVKNLSSPFKSCDVKDLYQEQVRIETILEQEKIDYELAREIQEEWNSRRPRRAAAKRRPTTNSLRPAKKFKV